MKRWFLILAVCAACIGRAPAQTNQALTVPQLLDELVTNAEKEIVPAAEAMPEAKYGFAPSEGEFHGVRTFGEQAKHLAAANYQLAARILNEEPPHHERNESAPSAISGKRETVEYLRGSFAYLHKAVATIDTNNLTDPIPGTTGTWRRARLGLAIDAIAHSYDHYGQMVEYLRINGIVPPASR